MSDILPSPQSAPPPVDPPKFPAVALRMILERIDPVITRLLMIPIIQVIYSRFRASVIFRIVFLIWIGLTLFCVGMAVQIYAAIPYSITLSMDRPTAIPPRFSDGRNFAAMKWTFSPLSGRIFHAVVAGKHINEETGEVIDVKIQKNPFFSCERVRRDPGVISAEIVNVPSLGDVCMEVNDEDGEEIQLYSWVKGGMFHSIAFPKASLSDEEKEALLQSIESVDVDITCLSKFFCFLTERGLLRWN